MDVVSFPHEFRMEWMKEEDYEDEAFQEALDTMYRLWTFGWCCVDGGGDGCGCGFYDSVRKVPVHIIIVVFL